MASQYLLRPIRTLKQACRDFAAAHPQARGKDCPTCGNYLLCAKSERTSLPQADAGRPGLLRIAYVRPLSLTRRQGI